TRMEGVLIQWCYLSCQHSNIWLINRPVLFPSKWDFVRNSIELTTENTVIADKQLIARRCGSWFG
ncbi:hypothetical protein, partial [Paenibacillus oryzisoli]|uniref:hypothetical protein n=1 Tax=Paenibacillus oryzisoli TaxID=1850517 RepID=UPI00195748F7